MRRIDYGASVFSAELHGFLLTVNSVIEAKLKESMIYTDSQSALKALISNEKAKDLLVTQ